MDHTLDKRQILTIISSLSDLLLIIYITFRVEIPINNRLSKASHYSANQCECHYSKKEA